MKRTHKKVATFTKRRVKIKASCRGCF